MTPIGDNLQASELYCKKGEYILSFAAIINYYTCSNFKQHKTIILQSWKSVVQNGFCRTIIKVLALFPSLAAEGRLFSLLFPTSEVVSIPLLCPPILKGSNGWSFLYHIILTLFPLSYTFKGFLSLKWSFLDNPG